MALTARLKLVFDQLIPGADVWDICCDHGYLGGEAYKSKKFKNIYFVDSVPSIMRGLESRFNTYVLDANNPSQVHFLIQEAQKIDQVINGTVTIIGVGGMLIYEILEALAKNNFLKSQRLVLGPHRDTEVLLAKIAQHPFLSQYTLSSRKQMKESTRTREFFIFDQSADSP